MTPESGGSSYGLLGVDKPEGWTSHDVVDFVRKRLSVPKAGHTGTLDPLATGVLILCLGRATRLSSYLSGLDKTYEATVRLGVRTDTMDADGAVIDRSETVPDTTDLIRSELPSFTGQVFQIPPMFSARKVGGRKLYELARKGQEVERQSRQVAIHELTLTGYHPPDLNLRVRCSTGTYIRVLADDLGQALGCGGHITRLRRTQVGGIGLDQCHTVEVLEERWYDPVGSNGGSDGMLIDPGAALSHLPELSLSDVQLRAFRHGNAVREVKMETTLGGGELVRACDPHGRLVGIGKWAADRTALQPVRVLQPEEG